MALFGLHDFTVVILAGIAGLTIFLCVFVVAATRPGKNIKHMKKRQEFENK